MQGIKKPSFFAYKFLNQLAPEEVASSDPETYVTTDDRHDIKVLFWDLTKVKPDAVSNQAYFQKPHPATAKGDTVLALTHCHPGAYRMTVYRIGYNKNDAYSRYLDWGSPPNLSFQQAQQLKDLATGAPDSTSEVTVSADGTFTHRFPTRTNDVYLISLRPQ